MHVYVTGADPEFLIRGAHLQKLRRAEGGAKIFGVFRVKNHDFTPKNHIFSNFRGGGGAAPGAPPGSAPVLASAYCIVLYRTIGSSTNYTNWVDVFIIYRIYTHW